MEFKVVDHGNPVTTRGLPMQAVLNRYIMNKELLEKHPEKSELLTRHMNEAKELVFQLALANNGNASFRTLLSLDNLEEAGAYISG